MPACLPACLPISHCFPVIKHKCRVLKTGIYTTTHSMKKQILLFVVGLFSAVVAYYATLSVPEAIPNPNVLRGFTAFLDIMAPVYAHLPTSIRYFIDRPPITNNNPDLNVTETTLDGIPAIFYRPVGVDDKSLPAVIYLHGGGWMYGSIYQFHPMVANVAVSLNRSRPTLVISVGYRLAPKHKFPAAINDVTRGIVWLLGHTVELGIDKHRIVVMGDSAGGNLAAAVTQRLTFDVQYKDLPKLRAQILMYPVLQVFDLKTPSYQQNGRYRTLLLSSVLMAKMFSNYIVGNETLAPILINNEHIAPYVRTSTSYSKFVSHDLIPEEFKKENYAPPDINLGYDHVYNEIKDTVLNPDFAPLMRPILEGLPEAYITTCQFDILRDDGILYAKRLEKQNVKTTLRNYKTGYHGQPIPENSSFLVLHLIDDILKVLEEFTK
ncbi:neutral cholesterol ester hydrolase 1-like isoform X1 [Amphiura filiformis]|uniref:neutral cholesterol ester hydrolase 1-like isoform X1 n=1 Tax=Amphiura filiformis TaxID=82378 RepID=UPI003B21FC9A